MIHVLLIKSRFFILKRLETFSPSVKPLPAAFQLILYEHISNLDLSSFLLNTFSDIKFLIDVKHLNWHTEHFLAQSCACRCVFQAASNILEITNLSENVNFTLE